MPSPHPVLKAALLRLGSALLVMWLAASATFVALHALPGRIQDILAGDLELPGLKEAISAEWGLDRSLPEQYLDFIVRIAHGDFGSSYVMRQPVSKIIGSQVLPTVTLALLAGALATLIALTLATLTAGRPAVRVARVRAISVARAPASRASVTVGSTCEPMILLTGWRITYELPKSPCAMRTMKSRYCSGRLRSRPHSALMASFRPGSSRSPARMSWMRPGSACSATKVALAASHITSRALPRRSRAALSTGWGDGMATYLRSHRSCELEGESS